MKLRTLVIVLVLMLPLAQAAAATYLQGSDIPVPYDEQSLLELAAASGPSTLPTPDPGGPNKKYLSDDPNDYVLVPGNDPDMVYALGETPVESYPVAISAPATVATNAPPSVPAIRAITARTSSTTVGSPGADAPISTYIPPTYGLQHPNAVGYDTSAIGLVVPSMQGGLAPKDLYIAVPAFRFPALFG